KRRERGRLQAKEIREFRRQLPGDLRERISRIDAAVAPSAPFFWDLFRRRVDAHEMFRPLTNLDQVRDIAMKILRQEGHDLAGIVLKPFWGPPVLVFKAVPEHEEAVAAVEQGRTTDRGRELRRKIAALARPTRR